MPTVNRTLITCDRCLALIFDGETREQHTARVYTMILEASGPLNPEKIMKICGSCYTACGDCVVVNSGRS